MALLKNVKMLFSNVLSVDDLSGKYQVVVQLTEDQAADAEAAKIAVTTKEHDGQTQFHAKFKSKFKPRIVGHIASKDFDLEGSEIGRGSEVNIQYKFRPWKGPTGNTGIGQDLGAVQVLTLEAIGSGEFDDVDMGEGNEY